MLMAGLLRKGIRNGHLTIIDEKGRSRSFGDPSTSPAVTLRMRDRGVRYTLPFDPALVLAEAYIDGRMTIESGSLEDLVALSFINEESIAAFPMARIYDSISMVLRRLQQYNPIGRSLRNVAHHYDLSYDLYHEYLDDDMQYSCAYFPEGVDDLDEAQRLKCRHLGAKLCLEPGQRVLDIGCGWGGLAMYLARTFGCRVDGLTLSREQLAVARRRAEMAGLADRVSFHLRDYRDETGRYDRVVSVGMFEHVGVNHYRAFFRQLRRLLTADGVAVVHAIGRNAGPAATSTFIRKYIFPGGYSPALSEVMPAVERSGLWTCDIEILRLHYAWTLNLWRRRFAAARQRIAALYDERFCRIWELYLVGSELAFRLGDHMVFQIQLAGRRDAVPTTRDYIGRREREIAEVEHPGLRSSAA